MPPTYDAVQKELAEQVSDPGDFGFDTFRERVAAHGDPQDAFDTVHVAGTNGKGSCCHLIDAMLRAAGYATGRFTGPALTSLRDRIAVNGDRIPEQAVAALYERLGSVAPFSRFEYLTLLAFTYFKQQDVDVAVVETGLGGRRDATNVVDAAVNVITTVGDDHQAVLGETREAIAREKAGIIDTGAPTVTAADGAARDVIESVAEKQDAAIHQPINDLSVIDTAPLVLSYRGERVETQLYGTYQVENIATAIAAIRQLPGYTVPDDAIIDALESVTIPGRYEQVAANPPVFLDGAHNLSGVTALCNGLETVDTVVFGCIKKKPYEAMLDRLDAVADWFIFTRTPSDAACPPDQLAEHSAGTVIPDPVDAVQNACETADGTILVTGSMYLVGAVRDAMLAKQTTANVQT